MCTTDESGWRDNPTGGAPRLPSPSAIDPTVGIARLERDGNSLQRGDLVGVGLRLRESLSQQGFSVVAVVSHEIRSLKLRS
jgi:hypothetical protein